MKTKTRKKKELPVLSPFQPTEEHREKKFQASTKVLNALVKIRVAPSPIHGVGVFAMRDIKKGEKLYTGVLPEMFDLPYERFKELRPDVSEYLLGRWPLINMGSHFLCPDTVMAAFLNHSNKANYDAKKDKVLRDIKTGEEITEDYKLIEGWEKIHKWLKS